MDTQAQPEATNELRRFEEILAENKLIQIRIMVIDNTLGEMCDRIFGATPIESEGRADGPLPAESLLEMFQVTRDRTAVSLESVERRLKRIEGAV